MRADSATAVLTEPSSIPAKPPDRVHEPSRGCCHADPHRQCNPHHVGSSAAGASGWLDVQALVVDPNLVPINDFRLTGPLDDLDVVASRRVPRGTHGKRGLMFGSQHKAALFRRGSRHLLLGL